MNTNTITCVWCTGSIGSGEVICPHCLLPVDTGESKSNADSPSAPAKKITPPKKAVQKRASEDDVTPLSMESLNQRIQSVRSLKRRVSMGVDPGARYTAISIRDDRGEVYLSSTYYRDDSEDGIEWAKKCVDHVAALTEIFEVDVLAVEGVVEPTGFSGGRNASLNPRDIIRTALVVGAIVQAYRDNIIIVRPRKNGSIVDEGHYPSVLEGRRPKDLPGFKDSRVSTRKHEKSAYDVAGTALFMTR